MQNLTVIRPLIKCGRCIFSCLFLHFSTKQQRFQYDNVIIYDVIRFLEIFLTFEVLLWLSRDLWNPG